MKKKRKPRVITVDGLKVRIRRERGKVASFSVAVPPESPEDIAALKSFTINSPPCLPGKFNYHRRV